MNARLSALIAVLLLSGLLGGCASRSEIEEARRGNAEIREQITAIEQKLPVIEELRTYNKQLQATVAALREEVDALRKKAGEKPLSESEPAPEAP